MHTRDLLFLNIFLISIIAVSQAQDNTKSSTFVIYFTRGDINSDGNIDLSDAIYLLSYLFTGGNPPSCFDAADVNDNGSLGLSDSITLLLYLFSEDVDIPKPFLSCGVDPTSDDLPCDSFSQCEFQSFVANYDVLSTIAGKGDYREKGYNGWSEEFEGGPATDAELSRPHNAISDGLGNIYITDKDAHAIRKVTPDGIISTVAGTNSPGDDGDSPGIATERRLNSPNGMWVKEDGTVFILDIGNSKVRKLSRDGILTTLFHDPEGMYVGRGLWVSNDETLAYYVNATGQGINKWTSTGGIEPYAENFIQLGNLIVDKNGSLLVTDRGASMVYMITPDIDIVPIAGNGSSSGGGSGFPALDTGLSGVRGIWPHPLGGYLLATHEGSQVWYVDTLNIIHLVLDGYSDHSHSGDGENFQSPGYKISEARAVSVDFSGNIIITENDYGYIRMISRK